MASSCGEDPRATTDKLIAPVPVNLQCGRPHCTWRTNAKPLSRGTPQHPRSNARQDMPICIECRYPVKTLWREGAGDKAGGHNIRLTVCKNCGRFCDKYVEHDFVVLFIDLVLIKPQVYRHLLHNTLMKDEDEFAVCFCLFPSTLLFAFRSLANRSKSRPSSVSASYSSSSTST